MASPSGRTTKEAPGVLEQSHVTFSGELCTFWKYSCWHVNGALLEIE